MSAGGSYTRWHGPDLCLAGKQWIGSFPWGERAVVEIRHYSLFTPFPKLKQQ